jgi:hypothetical protein
MVTRAFPPEVVVVTNKPMTHYELMIEYLKQKVELKDWHAVWDAAIDLARIEDRRSQSDGGSEHG